MRERPILFSTPMVKSILNGTKTQTRRVIKSRHESGLFRVCRRVIDNQITNIESLDWDEANCDKDITCPYGQPGDVLWVRETFCYLIENQPIYKSDIIGEAKDENGNSLKWKPSIFMPKSACRILLRIKDVRIERLHDISEEDAIEEGVSGLYYKRPKGNNDCWKNYIEGTNGFGSARESFRSLWQSINGTESWYENPLVWKLTFEKLNA